MANDSISILLLQVIELKNEIIKLLKENNIDENLIEEIIIYFKENFGV